jgi:membrane protease YdiL (CAAX protease family)
VGILAIVVVLAGSVVGPHLSALLVLMWAHLSRTPWREIGYVRPPSWARDLAFGVVAGVALKLVMKAIVMPLLGAPERNPAFQHLVGNAAALPGILFGIVVVAGFGEETFFRGYLFERLRRPLGRGTVATALIVLVTSLLFGLAHLPLQGVPGAQQGAIVGIVYGAVYAMTGRLWPVMCLHVAFDLAAVAIIFWDLEPEVARLLFP